MNNCTVRLHILTFFIEADMERQLRQYSEVDMTLFDNQDRNK
ncbi:unnamed protein product (macronuclear) [Paramecium tetraurelia]|uniref:Uncharacterized protein n=1 Tax=Paramecium tetraurelia TaxID=5888 RepID=A0DDK2_PARTE|nr:uncharacterized protein GSPATT00039426001 [Paramecium tetraurelia]CAK81119.1 unnamed protein product [Paramecium tetraurelia]